MSLAEDKASINPYMAAAGPQGNCWPRRLCASMWSFMLFIQKPKVIFECISDTHSGHRYKKMENDQKQTEI